jgi:hypothetical protein
MEIVLDPLQEQVIRDLVQNRVTNLSSEIRHTDSPRVRQELRDEREALRRVLDKLQPVPV